LATYRMVAVGRNGKKNSKGDNRAGEREAELTQGRVSKKELGCTVGTWGKSVKGMDYAKRGPTPATGAGLGKENIGEKKGKPSLGCIEHTPPKNVGR